MPPPISVASPEAPPPEAASPVVSEVRAAVREELRAFSETLLQRLRAEAPGPRRAAMAEGARGTGSTLQVESASRATMGMSMAHSVPGAISEDSPRAGQPSFDPETLGDARRSYTRLRGPLPLARIRAVLCQGGALVRTESGEVARSRTEPRVPTIAFTGPGLVAATATEGSSMACAASGDGKSSTDSPWRPSNSLVASEYVGPLNSLAVQNHAKRLTQQHVRVSGNKPVRQKLIAHGSMAGKARLTTSASATFSASAWTRAPRTTADFRQLARGIVASNYFDLLIGVALVLNAILIGAQANLNASRRAPPEHFRAFDISFCIFFAIELALRVFAYGKLFLSGRDWWNHFDAALVLLQIADEMAVSQTGEANGVGFGDISVLRLVKILRLCRILRFLRVIRFVSELRKVMYLVVGSIMSFVWTGVLLLLMLYMLGVFFTQVVADYAVSGDLTAEQASNDADLHRFFGSTFASIDTLYKAITGGFDWMEVSHPLEDNVSPFVGLVFALYTAFAVLVLLNLVTGVFVDGALKVSRSDKETELLEKAYSLFARGDEDRTEITWEDFRACLDSPEAAQFFEALEISQGRAEDLFQLIDQSQAGTLSLEEIVAGGLMLQSPAKAIDVAVVAKNLEITMSNILEHFSSMSASHLVQPVPSEARRSKVVEAREAKLLEMS